MQPKKAISTTVAFLLMLTTAVSAFDPQPMAPVYQTVHALLKQNLDQNVHNAQIDIQKLGKKTRLPHCQTALDYQIMGKLPLRPGRHTVIVRCRQPSWKLFLSTRIKGRLPIVVSTQLIPRHSLIHPDQIKRHYLDTTRLPRGVLTDPKDAIGMRARRAIAPNTPIKAQMLLPPYWVHKGKPVTIVSRIGQIEVRARGIAQKDAVENELVAVKNMRSGKTVRGLVVAPNTVLVP